jgi:hypothetical protein
MTLREIEEKRLADKLHELRIERTALQERLAELERKELEIEYDIERLPEKRWLRASV